MGCGIWYLSRDFMYVDFIIERSTSLPSLKFSPLAEFEQIWIPMQAYPTYRIATKECGGGKPPPKLILVSHASPITAAFRHLSPPLPHI